METQPIFVNVPPVRLRARRVDEVSLAERVRTDALADGKWHALVRHGGSVGNSYGYRAETEGALAVSDPRGNVVVWMGRRNANKVSESGVAEECVAGSRALFDSRISAQPRIDAAWDAVKTAHRCALLRETLPGDAIVRLGGIDAIVGLTDAQVDQILAHARLHPENRISR